MAEVYVGGNAPIETKIFYGGEIVDADGDVTAEIFAIEEHPGDTSGVSLTSGSITITAEKSDVNIGSYEIDIPLYFTDTNKKLQIIWGYQHNGTVLTNSAYVDVVTPYASLAEAIEYLNLGTDPSDPNYKSYIELASAEKWARKKIENFTMQKFYLYNDYTTAYGSGSDILPLPFKLNEIHKLYLDDTLLINNMVSPVVNNWNQTVLVSENGFGIRVNRSSSLDNAVYVANGMVPPTINYYGNGAFYKDVRYKVLGKFGWSSVPSNVEEACIALMLDYFTKDQHWKNNYIKTIKTSDWEFEYTPQVHQGTGNAYVDQLLYPYVINGMVVI